MWKTDPKRLVFLAILFLIFSGKAVISQNLVDSTGYTWRILEVDTASIKAKIQFIPLISETATGISWDFGDDSTSTVTSPIHTFDITSDADTIFEVKMKYSIGTTEDSVIKQIPANSAFFWISYDLQLDTLASFKRIFRSGFLYPTNDKNLIGDMRYEWTIDNVVQDTFEFDDTHGQYPNIYYTFKTGGTHTIKLKTFNVDVPDSTIVYSRQITITPTFTTKEKFVNIPNVFSPNGDEINDYFKVATSGNSRISLKVFNRSGQLVYQQVANIVKWDGKNQNGRELSEGVYFYILEDLDGKYETAKGFFHIFRGK